ncbi:Xanthine dehydrogenase, molybdenum binding subunit [hydrothermal vent metagenome]|uniref:Xanthine dehydrogenase, molybdenum binding subunit n=1 Tax=hydrothermal vent metagenome TaxID=652676 RepID=A0A3B0T3P6_9ZZZZ
MSIGARTKRFDGPSKVDGTALYPGDIQLDNPLHAKVVFSNRPHARMVSMDTSTARAVPGVVTIVTAADVPMNEYGLTMFDQPVLVGVDGTGRSAVPSDISRWEADQIAVVIAESIEAAVAGAEALVVAWEDLPIVPDIDAALTGDTLVHAYNGKPTNVFYDYKIRRGNMAEGWAAADVVVEATYEMPHQEHAYLQPEAAVSYIDDEGRVTVKIAGQWIHEDRGQIAHALDIPDDEVRVIYPAIGGAFGGREDMTLQIVMALAARKVHAMGIDRPVRSVWNREESILGHHKRHRARVVTKWGATFDGKIVAVDADVYMDAGAYNYTSNKVLGNFHVAIAGPYAVPHVRIDSMAIYTTTVPGGAFRGFGAPQAGFVCESQINKIADALGLDPYEVRRRNLLGEGDPTITARPLPIGITMEQVLEECATRTDTWRESPAERDVRPFASLPPSDSAVRTGTGIGIGFKNVGFSFGFPERCEATIELGGDSDEYDSATVFHAGADVGQGAHTVFAQMAADALGLPVEAVGREMSDTATSGDSGSASASRLTWMAGHAIGEAAAVAQKAWGDGDRPARGHYRYEPPSSEMIDPDTGEGAPFITCGYVAEAVQLAIDVETGHIEILRMVCVTDAGRVVNPLLAEGQIEGAVIQALGYTLTERLVVHDGRITNPRLSGYLIPGVADIPRDLEVVNLELPDPQGPWGIRGIAEMPMIPCAPAVIAAVHDATGVWIDEFPLTPDLVRKHLRAAGIG